MTDQLVTFAAIFSLISAGAPTARMLRLSAMASNLCFIAYGWQAELATVLLCLHATLLPINAFKACRDWRPRPPAMAQAAGIRCSTISAHQEQPAGIASSSKSYAGWCTFAVSPLPTRM